MELFEFKTEDSFFHENGFHLTSDISRIGKIIVHYELYKKIINLPGNVVECGVFKGNSLIRWGTFRELFENKLSRKIIGFDVFGDFPETDFEEDKELRENFVTTSGTPIALDELQTVLDFKKMENCELVKGNVLETIPEYIDNNPQLRISLLHIDIDVYEPAKIILEKFWDHIVPGGVIVLDDYGIFPGETKAVDEFITDKNVIINKFPFGHASASYIIK